MPQTQSVNNTESLEDSSMDENFTGGTVSEGTLREEDLVPAFLYALGTLDGTRADVIATGYADVIEHLTQGLEPNPDEVQSLMEDLYDALGFAAPDGFFFGAHEGDGACFGFWPDEDEDGDEEVPQTQDDDTEREYLVTWTIDISATSPEDAAEQALAIHRDPESIATVFSVTGPDDVVTVVDLDEVPQTH